MSQQKIRPYIMALYTLKDEFISILKAKDDEGLGKVSEPEMVLKDDCTQELKFSIPMYIRKNGELIENPAWWNIDNGNLILGMRKIKVIFGEPSEIDKIKFESIASRKFDDKLYISNAGVIVGEHDEMHEKEGKYEHSLTFYSDTKDFKVFEFIITKVTESHSDSIETCEIEAEGLPFHELGKTGYKIKLGQEDYELEFAAWYDGIIAKEVIFKSTRGLEIPNNVIDGNTLNLTFREQVNPEIGDVYKQVNNGFVELRLEDFVNHDRTYDLSFYCDNYEDNFAGVEWFFSKKELKLIGDIIDSKELTGIEKHQLEKENSIVLTFDKSDEAMSSIFIYFIRNGVSFDGGEVPSISSFSLKQKEEVQANVNYWVEKVLDGTRWGYEVVNDWSKLDGKIELDYESFEQYVKNMVNDERETLGLRRMDKIYEDEYVSSWKVEESDGEKKLVPEEYQSLKEKERIVECEESNRFNIIMDIAEKFESAVKFVYEYDRYFRITGRKVVFYNSIIKDRDIFDITYPYDTSEITREMDCNDIVTKMYVKSIDDDTSLTGKISISDSQANKTKEDYILNFEYMRDIGTISAEQYDEIAKFEAAVRELNDEIESLQNESSQYQIAISKQEGIASANETKIAEANEQIKEATDKINAIIASVGSGNQFVVNRNAEAYTLLYDSSGTGYINIRRTGIIKDTLKIYKSDPKNKTDAEIAKIATVSFGKTESDKDCTKVYFNKTDSSGNTTAISIDTNFLYATYSYNPTLYYTKIKTEYENAFALAVAEKKEAEDKVTAYKKKTNDNSMNLKSLLKEKEELIDSFERIMGPAIREGNWQDEEYTDIGDANSYHIDEENVNFGECKFIFDDNLFDDEQKAYFEYGVEMKRAYYPYIEIDENTDLSDVENIFLVYNNYWEKVDESTMTESQIKSAEQWRARELTDSGLYDDVAKKYSTGDFCYVETLDNDVVEYYKCLSDNYGKNPTLFSGQDYYGINSKLIPAFLKKDNKIIYVLLIKDASLYDYDAGKWIFEMTSTIEETGFENAKFANIEAEYIYDIDEGTKPTIVPEYVDATVNIKINEKTKVGNEEVYWEAVYPRITIENMNIKTDSTSETDDSSSPAPKIYIGAEAISTNQLTQFEDFSVLPRYAQPDEIDKDCYCLTIKPIVYMKNNLSIKNPDWLVSYRISNACTSIYLDALKVSKENAYPQVTYTVKVNAINKTVIANLFDKLSQICHINDADLKFKNVRGYISEINMNLDEPWEDEITVNNYKTKFEDLFSSIVASTEQMKANGTAYERAASAFLTTGALSPDTLNEVLNSRVINYNFDSGKLTISEENGIWAISDDGVVAMRGGGISIANQKNANGSWQWHTGITPLGINASLINAGQINLEKIFIYAGSNVAYQMNSTGLYAYRQTSEEEFINSEYVVHNGEGLFLVNKAGEHTILVPKSSLQENIESYTPSDEDVPTEGEENDLPILPEDEESTDKTEEEDEEITEKDEGAELDTDEDEYGESEVEDEETTPEKTEEMVEKTITLKEDVNRVEISWDGLIIRNYENEKVFYADTEGNLTLTGTINANSGNIGGWKITNDGLLSEDGSVELTPNSEDILKVGTNDNSFIIGKDGIVRGTSIIVEGVVAAEEVLVDGAPMTAVIKKVGIKPGIYASPMLGETMKKNDGYLKYLISSYDIESELKQDKVILQVFNDDIWEVLEDTATGEQLANIETYSDDMIVSKSDDDDPQKKFPNNVNVSPNKLYKCDGSSLCFKLKNGGVLITKKYNDFENFAEEKTFEFYVTFTPVGAKEPSIKETISLTLQPTDTEVSQLLTFNYFGTYTIKETTKWYTNTDEATYTKYFTMGGGQSYAFEDETISFNVNIENYAIEKNYISTTKREKPSEDSSDDSLVSKGDAITDESGISTQEDDGIISDDEELIDKSDETLYDKVVEDEIETGKYYYLFKNASKINGVSESGETLSLEGDGDYCTENLYDYVIATIKYSIMNGQDKKLFRFKFDDSLSEEEELPNEDDDSMNNENTDDLYDEGEEYDYPENEEPEEEEDIVDKGYEYPDDIQDTTNDLESEDLSGYEVESPDESESDDYEVDDDEESDPEPEPEEEDEYEKWPDDGELEPKEEYDGIDDIEKEEIKNEILKQKIYYTDIFTIDSIDTREVEQLYVEIGETIESLKEITSNNAWWYKDDDNDMDSNSYHSNMYFGNKTAYNSGEYSAIRLSNASVGIVTYNKAKDEDTELALFAENKLALGRRYELKYDETDGFWFQPVIH